MLKILQTRFQQYVNCELPDVQAGFRKGRGNRDQIANICWIIKKTREFQKNIYFCFSDYAKAFVWITTNCGKFFKIWEYQTTWSISWEICMQVKKQQLEMDMEQQTGPNRGRSTCILSSCLFNLYGEYIMWNARLDKEQAGIKIAGRNINNLRLADDTTLMAESKEELKSLLMKVKEESEKVGLKLNIQKMKIVASGPITWRQIDGETVETVAEFILGGSKITADVTAAKKLKGPYSLEEKLWPT